MRSQWMRPTPAKRTMSSMSALKTRPGWRRTAIELSWYACESDMSTQCRFTSIGVGVGKPLSYSAFMKAYLQSGVWRVARGAWRVARGEE